MSNNFKGWDKESVDKLLNRSVVPNLIPRKVIKSKSGKPQKLVLPKQMPRGLAFIIAFLSKENIDFIPEYKFLPNRKFRFDVAIPSMMVAVEFEGIISAKSRHTTITGFSKDCEKYNEGQIAGWIILRYTVLNYNNIISDFDKLYQKHNNGK